VSSSVPTTQNKKGNQMNIQDTLKKLKNSFEDSTITNGVWELRIQNRALGYDNDEYSDRSSLQSKLEKFNEMFLSKIRAVAPNVEIENDYEYEYGICDFSVKAFKA
jgi:hypothetical protein